MAMVSRYKEYWPDLDACPQMAYMDLWPIQDPVAMSLHPALSAQLTQEHNLPKGKIVRKGLKPLGANQDLVTLNGAEWKEWRVRFNPGFSARNVSSLVPAMLEEALVFIDVLENFAGKDGEWGEVFQLEQKTTDLTFDVIGRAIL